ncbi:unnamed protein product [Chilo suppressalis]|uniref:Uncharacterized protein n=1 Tax=Chilo suppressalis TaxID=168631 RepID=A0ABN8AQ76_CHISP|nr:unnamed protein product [Chilo suppressalis]
MEEPGKRCVFCAKQDLSNIILFNTKTLEQCAQTLLIRQKFKLKFCDVALPAEISDAAGYHRQCYSNFTALKSVYKKKNVSETTSVPSTSAAVEMTESSVSTELSFDENCGQDDDSARKFPIPRKYLKANDDYNHDEPVLFINSRRLALYSFATDTQQIERASYELLQAKKQKLIELFREYEGYNCQILALDECDNEDIDDYENEEGDMDESADMNDRQGFSDASDDDGF